MSINFNPGSPRSIPLKTLDAGTSKTSGIVSSSTPEDPKEGIDYASLKDVLAAVEDSGDPKFKDGIISQEELNSYVNASKNDPTKNGTLAFKTAEKLNGGQGKITIADVDGFTGASPGENGDMANNNKRLDLGDQKSYEFWMRIGLG